jgi:hypothetical protein
MLIGIFKAKSIFVPPVENFALPWKKVYGHPCSGPVKFIYLWFKKEPFIDIYLTGF